MGVDKRGKERGACGNCDCSDFEDQGSSSPRCGYCDCAPTKHTLLGYNQDARLNRPVQTATKPLALKASAPTRGSALPDRTRDVTRDVTRDLPGLDPLPAAGTDDWTKVDKDILGLAAVQEDKEPEPVTSTKPSVGWGDVPKTAAQQPTNAKSKARENARAGAPARRRGPAGRSATPPKSDKKPLKKKSIAVKCHNLDQIMSSHLADQRTAERIDAMFQSFDDDGSNELDREECAQLTGHILQECGLQPDIIPSFVYDEAFSKYDDDGGGTITLNEFREYLMSHLIKK